MSATRPGGALVTGAAVLAVLMTAWSPWPFASVQPLWQGVLILPLLALGVVISAAGALGRGPLPRLPGRLLALLAATPLVPLLGVVPLPAGLVDLVQPAASRLLGAAAEHQAWRALSLDPATTLDTAAFAAALVVVVIAVVASARGPTARAALAGILVLSGVAVAVFGVVHRLTAPDSQTMFWTVQIAEVGTPFGPFVNRNHFGGAMVLFAGLAVGLAARAAARGRKSVAGLWALSAAVLLVALLATTSRGALLGAAVAAGTLMLFSPARARRRVLLWSGAALALGLVALFATGLLGGLLERLTSLQERWLARFLVQGDALRILTDFPLFGTGAGTFPTVYPALQTVEAERGFSNAHSDWVQLLMETGLLGAALLAALVAEAARVVRRGLRGDGPERWMVAAPAAACVGLAAHGLVEVNLHVPSNALLAACALSIAYAASGDVIDGLSGGAAHSSGRRECSDESEAEATVPPVRPESS